MREAFSKSLIEFAKADDRIVLLTGDHGYALFDEFRKLCPQQYINAGVAEQNMVGVAAGLAKAGYRPIVYGLSAFVPIRVLEQIKLDVCYETLPVIFIGDGAGIVYSALGSSHQSAEDVAALRAIPNLVIASPADAFEMEACFRAARRAELPVYIRMGKSDLGSIHSAPMEIEIGDLSCIKQNEGNIAFVATGSMVKSALEIAQYWPEASVWSAPWLKPLSQDRIIRICEQNKLVVVMEEHSVFGGLGSAVAEISTTHYPTFVCRIGIADKFSRKCGSYEYLLREHGLDIEQIIAQINDFTRSQHAADWLRNE